MRLVGEMIPAVFVQPGTAGPGGERLGWSVVVLETDGLLGPGDVWFDVLEVVYIETGPAMSEYTARECMQRLSSGPYRRGTPVFTGSGTYRGRDYRVRLLPPGVEQEDYETPDVVAGGAEIQGVGR